MTRPDSPHRPKSNAPAIWLAIGVVVVLLGIVAVMAARGSNTDNSDVGDQVSDVKVPGTTTPPSDQGPATTAGEPGAPTTTQPLSAPGSTPLPRFENPADDSAVGMIIPTIEGKNIQGEPMTIGADGKAKIVMFVAHWCSHCQVEVPAIVDHLKDTPMPDDVELVAVSTAVDEAAPNYPPVRWLKREGWKVPTMADSADQVAGTYYGLSGFPFFVATDADGKVVFRTSGEISMDQFDDLVEAAQSGSAPQ